MEIWLRGWDLHQTGDWWIENAFVVPKEKIKVLSIVLSEILKADVILRERQRPKNPPKFLTPFSRQRIL
jgi:hypothetical protein